MAPGTASEVHLYQFHLFRTKLFVQIFPEAEQDFLTSHFVASLI
jgi:hypothetical protein